MRIACAPTGKVGRIGPGLAFKVSCYLKCVRVTARDGLHVGLSTDLKSVFPDSQKTPPVAALTLKDCQAAQTQDFFLELAGYCPLPVFLSWPPNQVYAECQVKNQTYFS